MDGSEGKTYPSTRPYPQSARGDEAAGVVPAAHHTSMEPLDDLLRVRVRLEPGLGQEITEAERKGENDTPDENEDRPGILGTRAVLGVGVALRRIGL
jgi:hypothetical protein